MHTTGYIEKIKLLLPSGLEYAIERVSVKFYVMDRALSENNFQYV